MNAVGIDVSKGTSMVAVMRPFGEVVHQITPLLFYLYFTALRVLRKELFQAILCCIRHFDESFCEVVSTGY